MYPITLTKNLADIEICGMRLEELEHPDFRYPWEIVVWMRDNITQILKLKTQHASSAVRRRGGNHNLNMPHRQSAEEAELKTYDGQKNVYVGNNVAISQYVVFDASGGQIVIDDEVKVGSFSYIEGPCHIGKNCTIMPHSQIRKNTSIGHHCKIGGEASGSIFQPFTNKAHHGFVGDSYVGSWVNLGAGTSTSNLKNTYGNVKCQMSLQYGGQANVKSNPNVKCQTAQGVEKIDTGQQFLGCVIGDYTKAAINTSIYTGKIIGVCAQLFGVIDENVGSFVMKLPNSQKQEFELDAAIRCQKRMFERRGIEQTEDDVKILERVFEETREERSKLKTQNLKPQLKI
ncbi:MAG: hypothetical protein ABH896_01100 [Candidatus Jacksonbacteria bacterium]